MDRLTPFTPDDVCYAHQILGQDRTRGVLRLRLALVPKAWIVPLLERLAAAGTAPAILEALAPEGDTIRLPVVADVASQAGRLRSARRLAVVAFPVLRQSLTLADLQRRMDDLRPRIEQVEALRKRIAATQAGAGKAAQAHQPAADALAALGVLTQALPDDT